MAFIDLDDFKQVNDRLGHAVGDELLVTVATRLIAQVRPQDLVGRIGADEFAVLLREVGGIEDLEALARRLLRGLAAPSTTSGTELTITVSMGVARATGSRDAETLLAAADAAMYDAKRDGKNAFRLVQ